MSDHYKSDDGVADIDDTIAGFAFGNVDKFGRLENQSLSTTELSALQNISDVAEVKHIRKNVLQKDNHEQTNGHIPQESAVDFSGIQETFEGELISIPKSISESKNLTRKQPT